MGSRTDVLTETEVVLSQNSHRRRLLQEPIRNLSWVEGIAHNPEGDTIRNLQAGVVGVTANESIIWILGGGGFNLQSMMMYDVHEREFIDFGIYNLSAELNGWTLWITDWRYTIFTNRWWNIW